MKDYWSLTLVSDLSHEVAIANDTYIGMLTAESNGSRQEHHYRIAMSNDIIDFIKIYFTPILLFVGTLGNIILFLVFSQPSLKHSTAAFYFRILAIADTLALNFGLWPNWMRDCFGIYIYPITDTSCRIQTYLRYTLPDCAVWVLVIMTIERLVGVLWPHHVRTIFTCHRVRISVFVMAIFIAAVNIPSLWVATVDNGNMSIQPCKAANQLLAYDIWPWIDLTIYSLLPFLIMMSCAVVIIITVYRRQRMFSRRGSINDTRGSQVKTLTVTLLIVVFVFLLLTSPFVIYATTLRSLYGKVNVDFTLFFFVASCLRYVNNSVNFVLYCISGTSFRIELMALFRNRRRLIRGSFSRTESTAINVGRGSIATYVNDARGSIGSYVNNWRGSIDSYVNNGRDSIGSCFNVGKASISSNRQCMPINVIESPVILELRAKMCSEQT